MKRSFQLPLAALAVFGLAATAIAQDRPGLSGMYSDPEGLEDFFCLFWCSDAGLERLNALLDDPANDERSVMELYNEAAIYQRDEMLYPRLTPEAIATLGLDPADDPGFLECEPWGLARELFAPHQLQLEQHDDRVDMLYGEWAIRRSVYLDGRAVPDDEPLSPLGYSIGHYDGDALVIETTRISANLAPWGGGFVTVVMLDGMHSDQLRTVERYTRSANGGLILDVTLDDPWALREPVTLKKKWRWAPEQEIGPYDDCEKPTEFSRGVSPQ